MCFKAPHRYNRQKKSKPQQAKPLGVQCSHRGKETQKPPPRTEFDYAFFHIFSFQCAKSRHSPLSCGGFSFALNLTGIKQYSLEKSKSRHCIYPCYNTGVVNDDVVIPPLIKIVAKACHGSLAAAGFCVIWQPTGITGKKSKPQQAKPLGVQCSH